MRRTTSTSFVTPIKNDGVVQEESCVEFGRGSYTLVAGTTYYYPIGGQDARALAAHCQWDASLVLTSITIEDCCMAEHDVTSYSSNAGEWIDEDPTSAFVALVGASASSSNGVVAVAGGAQGGAMFQIDGTGARRTRLKVVVGATGGEMRVASWGKD